MVKGFVSRRAQSGLEYMIIVSIALLLVVPLISYSRDMVGSLEDSRDTERLVRSMDHIESGVRRVYSRGSGTKITFEVELPTSVVYSETSDNYFMYVLDKGGSESEYYTELDFPLQGDIPGNGGVYKVVVESKGDYVEISYE